MERILQEQTEATEMDQQRPLRSPRQDSLFTLFSVRQFEATSFRERVLVL